MELLAEEDDGEDELKGLNLSGTKLAALPADLDVDLEDLDVSENKKLTSLDGIGRLKQLEKLDASSCKLVKIPDEIGECVALRELLVYSNKLNELTKRIDGCAQLETFNAFNNGLKMLPVSMGAMTHLEEVNVSANRLMMITDLHFASWTNLRILSLYDNNLVRFGSLAPMVRLEELRLNGNNLEDMPTLNSAGHPELKLFEMHKNRISHIDEEYFNALPALQRLSLWGNTLAALPDSLRTSCTALVGLQVHGNSLSGLPSGGAWSAELEALFIGDQQDQQGFEGDRPSSFYLPPGLAKCPKLRRVNLSGLVLDDASKRIADDLCAICLEQSSGDGTFWGPDGVKLPYKDKDGGGEAEEDVSNAAMDGADDEMPPPGVQRQSTDAVLGMLSNAHGSALNLLEASTDFQPLAAAVVAAPAAPPANVERAKTFGKLRASETPRSEGGEEEAEGDGGSAEAKTVMVYPAARLVLRAVGAGILASREEEEAREAAAAEAKAAEEAKASADAKAKAEAAAKPIHYPGGRKRRESNEIVAKDPSLRKALSLKTEALPKRKPPPPADPKADADSFVSHASDPKTPKTPPLSDFPPKVRAQLESLFGAFDSDGSGALGVDEVLEMCAELDLGMTTDELKELVASTDTDGSGEIEFDEFVTALRRHLSGSSGGGGLGAAFAKKSQQAGIGELFGWFGGLFVAPPAAAPSDDESDDGDEADAVEAADPLGMNAKGRTVDSPVSTPIGSRLSTPVAPERHGGPELQWANLRGDTTPTAEWAQPQRRTSLSPPGMRNGTDGMGHSLANRGGAHRPSRESKETSEPPGLETPHSMMDEPIEPKGFRNGRLKGAVNQVIAGLDSFLPPLVRPAHLTARAETCRRSSRAWTQSPSGKQRISSGWPSRRLRAA